MQSFMRWTIFALFLALTLQASEVRSPDFTLSIPMRDGTDLPADFYLPQSQEGSYPCILMRNPSGRRASPWVQYAGLSDLGYVVVIQDTRSAADPTKQVMPYWSDGWGEQQDGYDTVEWLARHSTTNGTIGTIGFSAPGITQLLLAPTAPPSLKCQYVGVAAANLYKQCVFNGGQVLKNQVEGWIGAHGNNPTHLNLVLTQPQYNRFWHQLNSVSVAHRVKVPAIHYGGWFDVFLEGTLEAFVSRQNFGAPGARGCQKMIVGPWTHRWPASLALGDFEVPLSGRAPPGNMSPEYWFDHYLKGEDNGAPLLPSVQYYVMGPLDGSPSKGNVWKIADNWPVPAQPAPLYLSPKLTLEPLVSPAGQRSYAYDPMHPVPTLGGRNLFLESGPKDQRSIEERSDVLVFTTEPLLQDMEVTGLIIAKIFFQSDAEDTDVSVRLSDVYPDGRSILIADGIVRLKHVANSSKEPVELEVNLSSTSMVFAQGHAVRVAVTSSNYPRYEKNLNGQTAQIAHNTVHMGRQYPSRIILPLVK